MEDHSIFGDVFSANSIFREVRLEEDDEEFRSCCEEEEDWSEVEEHVKEDLRETQELVKINRKDEFELGQFSARMYFKGVSITETGESSSGMSGIGVTIERGSNFPVIQVQKKLDFYVEQSVADYLALLDGLTEAMASKVHSVFAFTDSEILYYQIAHEERLENPLLIALRQRILEHISNLETFILKHVPTVDLEKAMRLAQVAIGIVSFSPDGSDGSTDNCSICREDKPSAMMITMKCSHKFCSHCMKTYVDNKLQSSQVPIKCPQLRCIYYISTPECKSFLPVTSYESLERSLAEADILDSDKFYCPFSNCSVLLDPHECLSSRESSSSELDNSCIECPVCKKFFCVGCGVPWHSSMSCEEYQSFPLEERDASGITLHRLALNNRWRRCQQCRRMVEFTQGCSHMTCWCGHEFCHSCGTEYRDNQQTCQCVLWDEENTDDLITHTQESEQWEWDTFNSLPMIMDAYSDQERSQLALIQRFLAGGFSLSDPHPNQSPPRCTDSYVDTLKDLHQLPWLERFVSVISDNYYEEYVQ